MALPSGDTRVVRPSGDLFAWRWASKVKKNGSKTVKKVTADKFDRSRGGGSEVGLFGQLDIMGPEAPEVLARTIGAEAAIVSVNPTDNTVN
jgi:hypothetical protein